MILRHAHFLFLSFLLILVISCSKTPSSEFPVIRLIDILRENNIEKSPILHIAGEKVSHPFSFLKSDPLFQADSDSILKEVRRKIKIGGTSRNVLLAPPQTEFRFNLEIPEGSVLEFGIGVVSEETDVEHSKLSGSEKREISFLITLENEDGTKILFRKSHTVIPGQKRPFFLMHSLDLSQYQGEGRLSFLTEGDKNISAFLYNPVIYKTSKNPQNVIIVSIDTLRADHLGCYGYSRDTSPSIDSLAQDSALFQNAYSTSPWTLPAHVSLLTGLNCVNHQVYMENDKIPRSLVTLTDVLRNNNFFSSAFTGGGFVSSAFGFSEGFDFYRETLSGIYNNQAAEWVGQEVVNWIDKNKDKNFFLFVHTYQPHNPYSCPAPYNSLFLGEDAKWEEVDLLKHIGGKKGIYKKLPENERQNIIDLYDGEIRYTDEKLIKPLIDKLKKTGLYDRSMIIITSDHGEEFFEHQGWEHGHSLYNELITIPLIIKFPGSKFRSQKKDGIVSLVDIMPTVVEELGLRVPDLDLDGKSLIPLLKGREKGDRSFLADKAGNLLNSHIPQKIATNQGRDKFILNKKYSPEDTDFFKYPPPVFSSVELYDLDQDHTEVSNIADKQPEKAKRFLDRINDIYQKAKKRAMEKVEIDKELLEQLKTLGYLR